MKLYPAKSLPIVFLSTGSMKTYLAFLLLFTISNGFSQQRSYFDPAQAYNRLLVEKNNGTYTQVSNFKVVGSSYLYGEKNKGDIFGASETGKDISLSYDTYKQNVYFFPGSDAGVGLTKEPGSLDSFRINKNAALGLEDNITFIYGTVLGSKDKNYFQVVTRGKNVSLYKKYTSELGMVSTNYIQAELRQFNILVDYYFADSTGKGLKKLKVNPKNISKEFSYIKDLSSFINTDELVSYRDQELVRIFQELNK